MLPGAHYLIRMLDGRIDSQGTVNELRADGVLDKITYESAVLAKEEEVAAEAAEENVDRPEDEAKKPRKLITDEHREIGGVKWGIYKTYLKASYVIDVCSKPELTISADPTLSTSSLASS